MNSLQLKEKTIFGVKNFNSDTITIFENLIKDPNIQFWVKENARNGLPKLKIYLSDVESDFDSIKNSYSLKEENEDIYNCLIYYINRRMMEIYNLNVLSVSSKKNKKIIRDFNKRTSSFMTSIKILC